MENTAISISTPKQEAIKSALKFWDDTEKYYMENNDKNFVRATKTLKRKLENLVDQKDMKELEDLDKKEEKELEQLAKEEKLHDNLKDKKKDEIKFAYAEKRLSAISKLIEKSGLLFDDF